MTPSPSSPTKPKRALIAIKRTARASNGMVERPARALAQPEAKQHRHLFRLPRFPPSSKRLLCAQSWIAIGAGLKRSMQGGWMRGFIAVAASVHMICWSNPASACFVHANAATFAGLDIAAVQKGRNRAYFLNENCATISDAACRGAAYLVPGDIVLVESVSDETACVAFVNKKGDLTSGFMLNSDLGAPPRPAPQKPSAFIGLWQGNTGEIAIKAGAARGELVFSGAASHGGSLADADLDARITTGGFEFTATPDGTSLAVNAAVEADPNSDVPGKAKPIETASQYDCTLRMTVRGPYLAVLDNGACGGANVSFSGYYRRD
jgi:hypothetical protein